MPASAPIRSSTDGTIAESAASREARMRFRVVSAAMTRTSRPSTRESSTTARTGSPWRMGSQKRASGAGARSTTGIARSPATGVLSESSSA
jgi:hypothetical protein